MVRSTIQVRFPRDILTALKRVMPDEKGYTNPERFRVLYKSSVVNLEDFLGGRKRKKRRKR